MPGKQPSQDIPDLRIVPVGRIIPHELHDEQRATPLVKQLRKDSILKSPVLVTEIPASDGSVDYMVLDGTNRSISLDLLGIGHAIVQVVPYREPFVTLLSWHHAISGISKDDLTARITKLSGVTPFETEPSEAEALIAKRAVIGYCTWTDGTVTAFPSEQMDLHKLTEFLQAVVAAYIQRAAVDRVASNNMEELMRAYPEIVAAVSFPIMEPDEIVTLTRNGWRVPAGITRHLIQGRALRLNYPLEELAASKSLEKKNSELLSWMQHKFQQREIRYYAEPTFLFDE